MPGLNHIDGETALWYSRSRYSTSDFDRTRRQQEVIMALFERILSLNGIEKAAELYDIYLENVTTNLSWLCIGIDSFIKLIRYPCIL